MANPDLIAEAKADLGEECKTVKDACLAFWGHGVADEQAGTATEPPFEHIFRVAHCIVTTVGSGATGLEEFPSETEAMQVFAARQAKLETGDDD